MNECIVLSKYRHLIPHEVFFKSMSGTKKLGLHRRRKKTGSEWRNVRGERASSYLASLSRTSFFLGPIILSWACYAGDEKRSVETGEHSHTSLLV